MEARQSRDSSRSRNEVRTFVRAGSHSHSVIGIELITTLGTEYVSWRMVRTFCKEALSTILVSVIVLTKKMCSMARRRTKAALLGFEPVGCYYGGLREQGTVYRDDIL